MSFDFDTLKDKLPGETLDKLRAHVDDLSTRAETAEEKARKAAKESIDGRKTLKATLDKAMAKLGVESAEELEALPDGKGAGEATKQFEAQIKKLTRERDEALQTATAAAGELKTTRRESALSQALEGQRFKNPADVRVLLQSRVVEEGDELLFKTDEGAQGRRGLVRQDPTRLRGAARRRGRRVRVQGHGVGCRWQRREDEDAGRVGLDGPQRAGVVRKGRRPGRRNALTPATSN